MKRAGAFVVTASLAFTAATLAQTNHWQRQVGDQLARATAAFRAQGLIHQEWTHTAALNAEESDALTVTLQAGVAYSLVGVCDVDCEALALRVSTATGNDLAVDQSSGALPVFTFTPTMTASYRVTVRMAACRMNPCWYGVALLRK